MTFDDRESTRPRISVKEYMLRYSDVLMGTWIHLTRDTAPRHGGLTDRLIHTVVASYGSKSDEAADPRAVATAALALLCLEGPREYGLFTASICRAIALDRRFVDQASECRERYRRIFHRPHRLKAAGYELLVTDDDLPRLIIASALLTEIAFRRFDKPLALFDRRFSEDPNSSRDPQQLLQRNPLRFNRTTHPVERREWAQWLLVLRGAIGAYETQERDAFHHLIAATAPLDADTDPGANIKRALDRDRFLSKSRVTLLTGAFRPTTAGDSQLSSFIEKILKLIGYPDRDPPPDSGRSIQEIEAPSLDLLSDPVMVGPLVAYEACTRVRELQEIALVENTRTIVAATRVDGIALDAPESPLQHTLEVLADDGDEVAEAVLSELETAAANLGHRPSRAPQSESEPSGSWLTALRDLFRVPNLAFAGALASVMVVVALGFQPKPEGPGPMTMRGADASVLLVTGEGAICPPLEQAKGSTELCRVRVGDQLELRYQLSSLTSIRVANVVLWDAESEFQQSQFTELGPTAPNPDCPDDFCSLAVSQVTTAEPFRIGVYLSDEPVDTTTMDQLEADLVEAECLRRQDIVGFHFKVAVDK